MDPLDELYFDWLYSQVGSVKDKNLSRTYRSLTRQLFTKEFVWLVPNDDNRLKDGLYLRPEFISTAGVPAPDSEWESVGCTLFEMLVALSRRAAEVAYHGSPSDWFWHMIDNLQIRFTDAEYNENVEVYVNDVLDRLIFRQYHSDGQGSLFPLRNPVHDQRNVEIWYQLNEYLLERE